MTSDAAGTDGVVVSASSIKASVISVAGRSACVVLRKGGKLAYAGTLSQSFLTWKG